MYSRVSPSSIPPNRHSAGRPGGARELAIAANEAHSSVWGATAMPERMAKSVGASSTDARGVKLNLSRWPPGIGVECDLPWLSRSEGQVTRNICRVAAKCLMLTSLQQRILSSSAPECSCAFTLLLPGGGGACV
jgi:hypothetical protein